MLPSVPNVEHLDFRSAFEDSTGLLRAELTTDGTHLNAAGYQIWSRHLAPIMKKLPAAPCSQY